ncbi:rhomboid family intramembrane serine protease [Aquibacillus rhizosphaerae]|uniref:Rhomboid family intramembrane serine protease n=1 Tax=Aquibacillus rhizosphaerae TaxID=3051431 RepID=A0ABT7L2Q2_9BACI|nr:rhomboid family intramembrane serine protease [Aquibacillus sp. LR5S19]MDL4840151.1 rhomboid family intramembrane serine protease [Aquibacillus sp. LR5S19]
MFIRTESFKDFIRFYPIVSTIVAIQLVIWLLIALGSPLGNFILQWGIGVNLLVEQGEYWRHITPIFLHSGTTHVLFNSFSLVLFGPALEQMLGKFKFILVYLATGIIANIFTYYLESSPYYTHLGASGAIYGLFGVYLYMVFLRKDLIDRANAQIVTTILVIGLVMTFVQSNINISAHLFGVISGLAFGPIILHNVEPFSIYRNRKRTKDESIPFDPNRWNKKRYRYKKYIGPIIWTIIALLVLFGLLSNFF